MLNSFHKNIQFTYEVESNAKLPFLDILLTRNHNHITTTVYQKESNSNVYLHWDSFTPISWKRGILKTLVERAYLICSTPRLLEKELTPTRTAFRNTNGYPNWIINQVFKQVKATQRHPVPNSNVSNENEAAETSNQRIVEKHDDKKHLLISYQGGKGEQVNKSVRKTKKRLLPSNIKVQVSFTGNKLSSCFSIKDKTKFGTCPETMCNDNYIGEAKRRIFERVKDHNGGDFISHLLKHAFENNNQHVSEKDLKIVGNGFRGNSMKMKVAETLLIREIKPALNIQDQSVLLQSFN